MKDATIIPEKSPAEETPQVDPLLVRQQELMQESQQIVAQLDNLNQQAARVAAMIKNGELALAGVTRAISELKRLSAEE